MQPLLGTRIGIAGGGVGIYGQGASGVSANTMSNPAPGSGGSVTTPSLFGGGGGAGVGSAPNNAGGVGAVRIIWPGDLRYFPSTFTANV